MKIKFCKICGSQWHYQTFCSQKKKKRPAQQSDKEKAYQVWKETIARDYVINRDGNNCRCCNRSARKDEKLDIDHIRSKGSTPAMKTSLTNMQLLCRNCHIKKTDGKECKHGEN